MRAPFRAALAVLTCLAFASTPARGAEGMWTFDNFPAARMRAEMGWAPDQAWLDRVMAATARIPGCSGSNVSADGLMLTNHHCIIACVNALSSAQNNYLADGFVAQRREDERRCPGMAIQVLAGITDVTNHIDAATRRVSPQGFAHARDEEIARLEGECSAGATRCEVVTLYQGGRYALYRYKRYDDVRMVFAPEHQMAAFGGDADNFNFPRYCADFSFLRLYENGRPALTPNHLNMRFTPLAPREIVLVAGNPGVTSRLRTSAEIAFERDVNLPWRLSMLSALNARLVAYAAQGPEQARVAASALQSVENSIKGLTGRRQALLNVEGFQRVVRAETELQEQVHRNPAAARDTGDAWGEIAAAENAYRGMYLAYNYLEPRAGERSDLFGWARDIVRVTVEREKPDAQRLPRYASARLSAVRQSLAADRPVTPDYEALHLQFWLSKLREELQGDQAAIAQRVLGQETPDALAQRLSQSRLADPAFRMALWSGGAAAVAASDDPMIVFVRAWDSDARRLRAQYEAQVEGPVARAQERIARARFGVYGDSIYPDATFSPRVSYGRVEGWTEATGRVTPPFTMFAGLFARVTRRAPFALAPRWAAARATLDPQTIFDVATSTDVIGGSSGSPLLDRDGAVVGAVFDGNMHSLGGEYFYDGALNRSVTVASTAIQAALRDVYHMDALLAELGGASGAATATQ
jgi:hypothetical protein